MTKSRCGSGSDGFGKSWIFAFYLVCSQIKRMSLNAFGIFVDKQ
jgi:hypothetical protein